MIRTLVLCLILISASSHAQNSPPPAENLQPEIATALTLVNSEIEADPKNAKNYFDRGRILIGIGDDGAAVEDFNRVLELAPEAVAAHSYRADANLRLGHFTKAVADYDALIAADASLKPRLWQRGIALYYAGRFADGAEQFTVHKTVNPNDVENAVWRLLCQVRAPGGSFAAARADLIPIKGDTRVPMMELYALFRGEATIKDVFDATEKGKPGPRERANRLFYAHYYIGLYHEARGETEQAREHLIRAAGEFAQDHFMGKLARVHLNARGWDKPERPEGKR